VSFVKIHCYGCPQTVAVEEQAMSPGLQRAGWALSQGETFCPRCAAERKLASLSGEDHGGAHADQHAATDAAAALEPFSPEGAVVAEPRGRRAMRLLRASLVVLRGDPQLLVFPAVAMALSLAVGAICFAVSLSGGDVGRHARGTILLAALIAAYPITFISLYCGVALAAVLGGRLEGQPLTARDGWTAATERVGIIAGWTLLTCTVGVVLRLIEQYVPLGAKIAVAIVDLSWTLATMFAVPVLAYENLGPRDVLRRSSQIFRQRWGTQLGGVVGIGVAGAVLFVPFIVLLVAGAATAGSAGVLLMVPGGAGLFAAVAVQSALNQVFGVFVYRSAVGLDTTGSPFAESDLQAPFARRRRAFGR
jgi:hypothetical protein